MFNRQRVLSAFILLCMFAILFGASYLRFVETNAPNATQVRDLDSVSRVVYYRVQNQAGPRFRLSGGEQAVRLITHLALERSAAWPVNQYRDSMRYPYGLEVSLLNPDGSLRWNRIIYLSSAVSKGEPKRGVWTKEAAFTETRTFVPTDARVTQIELPHDTPVNSSLEVRLRTPETSFAMVRAYGLRRDDNQINWLANMKMSPLEKREIVHGITYLSWDEVDNAQQDHRLATQVLRLTAASNVQSDSKIVPLYVSDYRVPRRPNIGTKETSFVPPWNQAFEVQGPTRLKLSLTFGHDQVLESEASPHLLYIQRNDEQGNTFMDVHPFQPWEHASSHRLDHFIEIPRGRHTLKLRWDPPDPGLGQSAVLRSRRNKILVSNAKTHTQELAYTLHDTKSSTLKLSSDSWVSPSIQSETPIPVSNWHSDYYYLSQDTGPIRFLIPGDQEIARIFKIQALDWDLAAHQNRTKSLSFAFLNQEDQRVDGGRSEISQSFDRDRWVTIQGTLKGVNEPQPLSIGVGTEQAFSGVAPKGARWIQLSASSPLLVRVSSRIPSTTSYSFRPIHANAPWQPKPRHWIPMLAAEHPKFDRKGWVIPVTSSPRDKKHHQDETGSSAKAWKGLLAEDQPAQHRILEETPYQSGSSGLQSDRRNYASLAQLWAECKNCWVELSPYRAYRVTDPWDLPNDPQALWLTTLKSSSCSIEIDGQTNSFLCPVIREKTAIEALCGGTHRFSWQSDSAFDRLWLNRSSTPVHGQGLTDGIAFYAERNITKLSASGQSYLVSKPQAGTKYLNFRIYRPLAKFSSSNGDLAKPLAVEIELDSGAPNRFSGQLFSHFTPSIKRTWLLPNATPELVFLDDDHAGPFERFEVGFFLGNDIKIGQHHVRIRAQSDKPLWVRAFEEGRDAPASSASVFGQLDPANSLR